jgi:L-malate glycosyltransferase
MTARSIGIVAVSLESPGGQGVQAAILAERLREEGYEITFIPVNPRFPAGLRWLRRYPYLRTFVNELLYLPSLLRIRGCDVVHIFSAAYWSFLISPLPAMLAARFFGKRVVLNYHSGQANDHLANWGMLVHPWLRFTDEIVVPSRYLEEVFAHYGYRVRVIPNVVDTSLYAYRDRAPLRPRLLSARNLEPHYCVENTLEAFRLIRSDFPDATITVAGGGTEEPRLRRLAESFRMSGVRFVGHVPPAGMPELYADTDVFLNSSIVDNQPVSVLEAFAAGLPVVSTTPGDLTFLVRHGETGLVVPRDDPAALAQAIRALLADPELARSIARRARLEVEEYTWSRVRSKWTELYADSAA